MVEESRFVVDEVLTILFDANAKLHSACADLIQTVEPYRYVRDFRTIRLGVGLRMGRTRVMLARAAASDLILSFGASDEPDDMIGATKAMIATTADLKNAKKRAVLAETRWSRIWIDDAFYLFSWDDFTTLCKDFVVDADQQFVLLG